MLIYGSGAELEYLGDVAVRLAASNPEQDFCLPGGQSEPGTQDVFIRRPVKADQMKQDLVGTDLPDIRHLQLLASPWADEGERRPGLGCAPNQVSSPVHRK